jgi:hypothetical protein
MALRFVRGSDFDFDFDFQRARVALTIALLAAATAAPAEARAQTAPPPDQAGAALPAPAPAPAQAAPPANPYDPSMQAGGLTPPPPMADPPPSQAPPSSTTQQLEEAKEEDSGRGLEFFYLNVEGGFEQVDLTTFSVNEEEFTAGLIATSSNGGVVGGGVGLRLLFLTLGARARAGFFQDWQLFSLGGEVGMHIPIGNLDPHFDLGFGYAGLGNVTGAIQGAADAVSIRGFYARAGGGLDYYITPAVSLGANISFELLGLTRPGVSADDIREIQSTNTSNADPATLEKVLAADGSSYGSALGITGVIGLHL